MNSLQYHSMVFCSASNPGAACCNPRQRVLRDQATLPHNPMFAHLRIRRCASFREADRGPWWYCPATASWLACECSPSAGGQRGDLVESPWHAARNEPYCRGSGECNARCIPLRPESDISTTIIDPTALHGVCAMLCTQTPSIVALCALAPVRQEQLTTRLRSQSMSRVA